MARINLLPWRAERRSQRQRQFAMMMLGAAVLGLLVTFGIVTYFSDRIENQQVRNNTLQNEIAQLEIQIKSIEDLETKKASLLQRKLVIEQLQANRSQMVHLFDELVRTIPEGVQLGSIKQNGDQLTLEGVSQSSARVSTYMRKLESSGWMSKPDLKVIENKNTENKALPYVFTLQVTLTKPGGDKDDEDTDDAVGGVR
ncbi:MAG: PilN domain-containing protein [Rhodanobacteraceae bacterium]|nr:PilN domain-containing protein [Rhodanobacteraceae bacterium]